MGYGACLGPLLTGERAHYEFAAAHDVKPFVRAMEQFATCTGMLTEQVWDEPDRPGMHMFLGRPTTAAMPLMWAHAEYIKLLRSVKDGQVFDFVPEVAERFQTCRAQKAGNMETKPARPIGKGRVDLANSGIGSVPSALVR